VAAPAACAGRPSNRHRCSRRHAAVGNAFKSVRPKISCFERQYGDSRSNNLSMFDGLSPTKVARKPIRLQLLDFRKLFGLQVRAELCIT